MEMIHDIVHFSGVFRPLDPIAYTLYNTGDTERHHIFILKCFD